MMLHKNVGAVIPLVACLLVAVTTTTDASADLSDLICVKSCVGLPDGDYQSCTSCHAYATCTFGDITDGRPCAKGLMWDDRAKQCMYESTTCNRPDTTPSPDYNSSTLQILIVGGKSSKSAYTLMIDQHGTLVGSRVILLSSTLPMIYHHASAAVNGTAVIVAGGEQKENAIFNYLYGSGGDGNVKFGHIVLPELRYHRKYQPAVFILGDSVYVAGGSAYNILSGGTMERFNMVTWKWEITDQTLPTDVANTASVVLQDRVYIIGGFTQTHYSIWFPYYKPTLSTLITWREGDKKMTKLAQMNKARYNHCAVSDGSNRIFVIGGVDYYLGVLSSAEVYHVEENRWQTIQAMPEELHSHACVYNDGLIYVIGGAKDRSEKKQVDTVWVYDMVANSWQLSATHLIEPASGHIAALVQPQYQYNHHTQ